MPTNKNPLLENARGGFFVENVVKSRGLLRSLQQKMNVTDTKLHLFSIPATFPVISQHLHTNVPFVNRAKNLMLLSIATDFQNFDFIKTKHQSCFIKHIPYVRLCDIMFNIGVCFMPKGIPLQKSAGFKSTS